MDGDIKSSRFEKLKYDLLYFYHTQWLLVLYFNLDTSSWSAKEDLSRFSMVDVTRAVTDLRSPAHSWPASTFCLQQLFTASSQPADGSARPTLDYAQTSSKTSKQCTALQTHHGRGPPNWSAGKCAWGEQSGVTGSVQRTSTPCFHSRCSE